MIRPLPHQPGHMLEKVRARDRIVLNNYRMRRTLDRSESAQMVGERAGVEFVDDDAAADSLLERRSLRCALWNGDNPNCGAHSTVSSCTDVTAVRIASDTPPGEVSTVSESTVALIGSPTRGVLK